MDVAGLTCADLVDATGRLHRHRCHILDLVSPTPGRVLFGPAVTISYFPSCSAGLDPERYNLANLFYEAVGDDPAEKVVVLASNGYTDTSMGGDTKLLRLQEHGCAGVLTDGRLRDFSELARYDFAAYCSGEATHWGGDQVTPFQVNVPVVLGRRRDPGRSDRRGPGGGTQNRGRGRRLPRADRPRTDPRGRVRAHTTDWRCR
jgi:4-hydroxy-4-methyl-2-oxoglutarate aldolase